MILLEPSQKTTKYQFYFLKRHQTIQLVQEYLHVMDKEDMKAYEDEIGNYIYEFQIVYPTSFSTAKAEQDQDDRWRVLKTKKQVQKFLSAQDNTFTFQQVSGSRQVIANIDCFSDSSFRILESESKGPSVFLPQIVIKFFQLYNVNIKKKTSFLMEKKTRGLTRVKRMHNWCVGVRWNFKRIIITREGVLQMADDGSVTDFLKFDGLFSMKSGSKSTKQQFGIALVSAQRKIVLKARNAMEFLSFLQCSHLYIISNKIHFRNHNQLCNSMSYYQIKVQQIINKKNKGLAHLSSCLKSAKNNIEYYVDADQYYKAVAEGLKMARTDVFMCGWWISPELYLKRPIRQKFDNQDQNRLDNLLRKVAEKGVKIYIVVFYAPFVIPNDSDHTKRTLAALHQNIIVQRHPHQILPKMWSHHEKAVIIDQKIAFLGGLDLCYGRYDDSDHLISNHDQLMYPGIDYNNVRIKDFVEVCKPQVDLQQRDLPRMPWHDVAFKVEGETASNVANHFVEYWNFTLLQKRMMPIVNKKAQQQKERQNLQKNAKTKQVGLEGLTKAMVQTGAKNKIQQHQKQKPNKSEPVQQQEILQIHNGAGENSLLLSMEGLKLLRDDKPINHDQIQLNDQLQLLRSASQWSIGLQEGLIERSIQNAYLDSIYHSKKFIYIENQFFISATGDKDSFVCNQIANALYERIERAHKEGASFRVVVFMPLLPGMQGSLDENCPLSLKLTMHWQYHTICRSENSLLKRVARLNNGDYKKYIQFFSLRKHGVLKGQPVTELIYIHTKLMIIDDNIVICGSANINDRSQKGDRDSQLAVIFTNGHQIECRMDGLKMAVNEKAHHLRVKLFMQHFGLMSKDVSDPILQQNVNRMRNTAEQNTLIYRQVFGCSPDDTATTFKKAIELHKIANNEKRQKYQYYEKKLTGHAVEFPTHFLQEEQLKSFGFDTIQDIFI